MILQAIVLAASLLRVCADPNYLPFSNSAGQGFENKIATVVAHYLNRKLEYTWESTRSDAGFGGFVHDTLDARRCDLIVDVPYGLGEIQTTRPYYISSYVFVYKKQKGYDLTSMDSPVLRRVRIGYEADTPAQGGLQLRALTPGSLPFEVADHPDESPGVILDAVDRNRINVGITWEPAIGYYLRQHPDLAVVTVPDSRSQGSPEQYTFPMAMGVRSDEGALLTQLNAVIAKHRTELDAILRQYGVRFFNSGDTYD